MGRRCPGAGVLMNTSRELRQHYREVLSQARSKDAGDKEDSEVTFDFVCARQLMDIIQDADNAELLEDRCGELTVLAFDQQTAIMRLQSSWWERLKHLVCFAYDRCRYRP